MGGMAGNHRPIRAEKDKFRTSCINLPKHQWSMLDLLVRTGFFGSTSEAIRHIIHIWEAEFLARIVDREKILKTFTNLPFTQKELAELIP